MPHTNQPLLSGIRNREGAPDTLLTEQARRSFLIKLFSCAAMGAIPGSVLATPRYGRAQGTPLNLQTILVAGTEHGALAPLAHAIAGALGGYLNGSALPAIVFQGAADGVTGANQFEARTAPDGQTALLAPGAAVLAWLAGDTRVHFDASGWVPVMAGTVSGVVLCRRDSFSLKSGSRPRIAVSGSIGPEMPVVLALDLLGLDPVPVLGITDTAAACSVLANGSVDAILLRGPAIHTSLPALSSVAQPLFTLDCVTEDGAQERDPALAGIPRCGEILAQHGVRGVSSPALLLALNAAIAASRLSFSLVLPHLSPAATIALWRRASGEAVTATDLTTLAESRTISLLAHGAATSNTLATIPTTEALLQLRQWLGRRMNWRPA
ncbi:Hypothetical protein GbCGDNIH9_0335 [Granulibacter bethesdensis]|uniref:Uncharacterized protein n=1 Tax=Granulibacter bethesdensis TaxID=364410 RepID=A0AAC9KAK8_9PROT|nr:hypothetical protein [Granulibacter bethesdensis]APH53563.1 Hypothetical protein GbCGDNIH9_0335 [Granulibacter bethesdensis]APH61141.1 Hypothetical protein GbCGDNIH8_0335 [Granulibacter bethesdensis]